MRERWQRKSFFVGGGSGADKKIAADVATRAAGLPKQATRPKKFTQKTE